VQAMIVRSDRTGLGYQTRALAMMLKPEKIMLIDSTPFNGNAQNPSWYDGFSGIVVKGFPSIREKLNFLGGVTSLLTCEIPYGYDLFSLAAQRGVKTYLQYNHEFCDYLLHPTLPQPTTFLSPSLWHLRDMKSRFPNTVYLPPPTFHTDFTEVRDENFSRTGRRRFLHVVGNLAVNDRNGTLSLLAALEHSTADYELVIKAQRPLPYEITDRRVTLDYQNVDDQAELYRGFDALIMPRRYGGLCLPMNEALMSGLPVIMTEISPNDQVLLQAWLVPAVAESQLMTRTMLDVYAASPAALGAKLDELAAMEEADLDAMKLEAFSLGYENYSAEKLKTKYEQLLSGELLPA
jgi:glycosyltransferase involved in cell wall biosynthesis